MKHAKNKNLSLASAVAITLAIPVDSFAGQLIRIGNLVGDSTAEGYLDYINIESLSWHMATDDRGRSCVSELSMSKTLSRATPGLAKSISAGTIFEEAQLKIVNTGADKIKDLLVYDMTGVRLTSMGTSASDGWPPQETFSLTFDELTGTYAQTGESFAIPGNRCK